MDDFLLFRPCRSESGSCFFIIFRDTSDNAFYKRAAEINSLIDEGRIRTCGDGRIYCGTGVAFSQCANQPTVGDTLRGGWICGANGIEYLMQRSGIGFPMEFHERTRYFRIDIVRLDGQRAVQYRVFFGEAPKTMETEGKLLQRERIAGIENNRAFQTAHCLLLFSSAPLDISF